MKRKLVGSLLIATPLAAFLWAVGPMIQKEAIAAMETFLFAVTGLIALAAGVIVLTTDGAGE